MVPVSFLLQFVLGLAVFDLRFTRLYFFRLYLLRNFPTSSIINTEIILNSPVKIAKNPKQIATEMKLVPFFREFCLVYALKSPGKSR